MNKILYIITRLDRGGSAEAVLQWAEGIKGLGYEVKLISGRTVEPHKDLVQYSTLSGVPIIWIPSLHRELEPLNDLKALFSLIRIIAKEKPQIVHTNTSKAGILGRLAAFFNRTPVIVHSPHGHIFYGYYGKLKTALFIWLERLTALLCQKITTLTQIGLEDHLKFKIAPRRKFTVIHAGISLEKFAQPQKSPAQIRTELKIDLNAFVVGWVGRMVEIKNPLLLIETAEKLFPVENFHFLMVGDGGLLEKCRERTLALGMAPKFTFTGHRQDVPDLMQAMNIFTLTSNNEGMGRSILEAQSAGLPVIATQVGGVPEIIRDNLTGLLIPPGDPAALACAIEKLYRDRQLGNRLAASARQQLPLYSLEKTIANLDHIYQELLKAKRIASL